jgi:AP endonuclease-2
MVELLSNIATGWDTRTNARESNYGTRIDYILLTKGLLPWFKHGDIQPDIRGSDHCPVFIDLYDEIPLPGGQISRLVDVLGPLADINERRRDPPPISTKFWDEFSGKQKLLSTFFARKPTQLMSQSGFILPEPSHRESDHNTEASAISLQHTLSTSSAKSSQPVSGENIPSRLPEVIERKRRAVGSTTEASTPESKKLKKLQIVDGVGKQPKLSAFFASTSSQPENSAKRPSSPPMELLDLGDDVDLSQSARGPSPSEISSALPASRTKGANSSKNAWSRLMRPIEPPRCIVHDALTKELTVNKAGPNKGKRFFVCSM